MLATGSKIHATEIRLREKIDQKISSVSQWADELPGIVIVHDVRTLNVEYMSQRGLDILRTSLDEIRQMGGEKYFSRYFNVQDAEDYLPRLMKLIKSSRDDEVVTFFQQVRPSKSEPWSWYFGTTKILMRDENNSPLLLFSIVHPVDPLRDVTFKVVRLLEEKKFFRHHQDKFKQLTKRERQVLSLTARGKSAVEIAGILYISDATVETHRRNIKRKLKTKSSFELSMYARSYDLI